MHFISSVLLEPGFPWVLCRAAVSSVQTDGKQLEILEWTALSGVVCVCVCVRLYNGVAAVSYCRLFSH